MFNLIGGFIRQPVVPDLLHLLIAVLAEAEEQEVVIHEGELAPVVVCWMVALVWHQFCEVIIRVLR